ncbi:MAG: hypothetical protein V4585_18795 [Bacteroidota bacterium]
MNALDNENDPFEDLFRDRFADFESEPASQLWNKIEPQLPVNPTRKYPYWQISAVALILLLTGWAVFNKTQILPLSSSIMVSALNEEASIEKKTGKSVNHIEKSTNIENKNTDSKTLMNTENKAITTTKNDDESKLSLNQLVTSNVQKKDSEKRILGSLNSEDVIAQKQIKRLSSVVSSPKDEEETNNSANKLASNNFSKKYKTRLNLLDSEKSNQSRFNTDKEINSNIFSPKSNTNSVSSVFNIENENPAKAINNKYTLTILDSKQYGLLANHFKKPKLKYVFVPKTEEYFRETKPLDVYFSAMPLLNYYTITPNGNDANYVHGITVNDDADRLGFYTQAGVVFTLSDKFKLRTGLTFTKTNHSINYQIRTDSLVVQSLDNKGVDVSFAEVNKTYSQSANYLGTKIELQYILLKGEALSHYVNVGVEGAYRLNGNHQFNGFANIAYGVTRQIGDNAYLFVEPTFSYSLNQQSDNNAFLLVKPNKIGFNIGVNFKIK